MNQQQPHKELCIIEKRVYPSKYDVSIGTIWGKLTITGTYETVRHGGRIDGKLIYLLPVKCECGNETRIERGNLTSGRTKTCGCGGKYKPTKRHVKHGKSQTAEYHIWKGIKLRCLDAKATCYKDYGGRGIKICDRWMDFENFNLDMGNRPTPKHSIDRYPDVNGNYEPGNCRWATIYEQANNTRKNVYIEINGVIKTLTQWSVINGINPITAQQRIMKGKFTPVEAVTIPVDPNWNKMPVTVYNDNERYEFRTQMDAAKFFTDRGIKTRSNVVSAALTFGRKLRGYNVCKTEFKQV